mmetsp:Transcript_35903/g.66745  ORF Transcript_35903/g.66745 Transcript_35903/m.66745 type:complete len:93 (-) Transcript_35903:34-312(-)
MTLTAVEVGMVITVDDGTSGTAVRAAASAPARAINAGLAAGDDAAATAGTVDDAGTVPPGGAGRRTKTGRIICTCLPGARQSTRRRICAPAG